MKVLYIAPECKPFSKVGGMADVAGELPPALKARGIDVEVVTPLFGCVDRKHVGRKLGDFSVRFRDRHGNQTQEQVSVYSGELEGVPVCFIQNPTYFEGPEYGDPFVFSKIPFYDDILRFSFFSEACLELIKRRVADNTAHDIVHVNDWPLSFLLGRMVMEGLPQKRVLTLHNIGYQGNIWKGNIRGWQIEQLLKSGRVGAFFEDPREKWESVNPLRLGFECANVVHAVSPTYAKEVTQVEDPSRYFEGGKGLHQTAKRLHEERRLVGILDAFSYDFEPTDEAFEATLSEKAYRKHELCGEFAKPDAFLLGFVGRAVEQKFKLLAEKLDGKSVLEHILGIPGVNVAILATGLAEYEYFMAGLARRPNYRCTIAFDKDKAKQISLGSDVFLMPSLFEPCGITQMEALSNATPPLVRRTGGLADTIKPHTARDGTGFVFDGNTREEVLRNLVQAVRDALELWSKDQAGFRALQRRGFDKRFLWPDSAKQYIDKLYAPLLQSYPDK